MTPQNTVLFIAEDARPWPDTLVTGDAVWEWTPETGELTPTLKLRRRAIYDKFAIEIESMYAIPRGGSTHPQAAHA